MKMQVHTLRAREEQLAREKELLDKSWQELKAEREKVNGAALRVRQQEEELKSMTEVSGASALPFPAAHGLAAKLGFHSPAKAGTESLSWKGKEGMPKGVVPQGSEGPCPQPPQPLCLAALLPEV